MNTSKIKSIKKIKCNKIPVYDISVPKYDNFVLANGLVVHNCKPYQYFQSTIYDGRIELYDDKLLFQEITDLERNMDTGKIDHPDGGSKDKCDAVCGAVFSASTHAEEFAFDYGESMEQILLANSDQGFDDVKSISAQLEEELKLLGPVLKKPTHPSNATEFSKRTDYNLYSDILIL